MASIHDPKYGLPAQPPAPFGSSPFKVRGRAYVDDLAHYEKLIPGKVWEAAARAGHPGLEPFMKQRFTLSAWYDLFPVCFMIQAVSRFRGVPYGQQLRENALFHAEKVTSGLSGIVLRALSHDAVALWLPRLSASFHDFGRVETQAAGPGVVRGLRTGVPQAWVHGWAVVATELAEEVLRRTGAAGARVHVLAPEPDAPLGGLPTWKLPFEVRWTV